jgi:ribosome-binding factor A
MQTGRQRRVAELVKQEIAQIVQREIKDPRVGFVSVMDVRMSPDLRHASVAVSLYGEDKERKGSMAGLRQSAGWIRRELGKRLRLRYTPEVRFFEDDTLDRAFRLEEVFKQLHGEEGASGESAEDANEADERDEDDGAS